jgi:predicted nucleotidyltransferase
MATEWNAPSSSASSVSRLHAEIRGILARHLDLTRYHLFLFGSESSGTASRGSDIDIGILGEEPVPGRVLERIREDLDTLRTLRRFDIVDFCSVDSAFKKEALKHAKEL